MANKGRISVTYRNYRGEVSVREITPHRLWYGSTEWHPEPGWLLEAYDAGKNALRDFALADCDFRQADADLRAENDALWEALLAIANDKPVRGELLNSVIYRMQSRARDALAAHPRTGDEGGTERPAGEGA